MGCFLKKGDPHGIQSNDNVNDRVRFVRLHGRERATHYKESARLADIRGKRA
jgi:hypothetical protein